MGRSSGMTGDDAYAILHKKIGSGGGESDTSDYNALANKPKLNGVEIVGNKTSADYKIVSSEQGAENNGKFLGVGSDGNVTPVDKPTYTATEVGADASGTADTKVSEHNVSEEAHNDIRLLVQGLTDRFNTLADSDDDTLDQMSEIVAYIKSNKTLIDAITTQKVSVADIVDNLTTNVSNKPLSAAQGVALKSLIDGITIPEKLPNPQKLIFSGAVTGEYDGSTELNVNIPESSGGGSYTLPIMSDTQLGGGKAVAKTDEDVPVAVDPMTGQLFVPTYPESASADIPRQEMQNTNINVTLEPNKLYVFPEMASLTVTLAEPDNSNVANEYHFFFTSGATATTLTLNDVLSDAYSIEANMKYEVSIVENVAYIKGVPLNE